MGKYLDWYVVELEGLISDKLRTDRVHELVTETHAHLQDTAAELAASGMSDSEAEIAAIERFGRVRQIARAALSSGRESSGTAQAVALGLFWFAVLASTYLGLFIAYSSTALSLLVALFIVAFSVATFKSRKMLWRPLLASSFALFLVASMIFGVVMVPGMRMIRRSQAPQFAADAMNLMILAEHERNEFDRLSKAPAPVAKPKQPAKWVIPVGESVQYGTAAHTRLGVPKVAYGVTYDAGEASRAWAKAAWMRDDLDAAIRANADREAMLRRSSGASYLDSALSNAPIAAAIVAVWAVGSLALNGMAVLLASALFGRSVVRRRFA